MSAKINAVKGMNDILPPLSSEWEWLESTLRDLMARYGYRNIRTPIVEHTGLFVRSLGEVTDVVEKEMYAFEDRLNGEQLALRPENTAGVVRAAVEHSLVHDGPKRLFYMGPMFRHERPQRGRYRQFHQFGAEALGFVGPDVDAELIVLAADLWQQLGLQDVTLEINSLGQLEERKAHRQALVAYLQEHESELDEDAKRRLHSNPLRILDTKNPDMQGLVNEAPKLMEYLGEGSLAHFDRLRALLDAHEVGYRINPRLVRGLDYYNLSVFEFVTTKLGAQGTICAGGRYDGLFEQIGGKPTPAVGWAMGIERLLELVREEGAMSQAPTPDVYAVIPAVEAVPVAMKVLRALRGQGVSAVMHAAVGDGMGSMKSQFKKADGSGARYALIFGEQELAAGNVAVKPLRAEPDAAPADQFIESLDNPAAWAAKLKH
ncbi:histidine--tRNA ligase [Hydrogenophaga sp. 5NK40-0174]|uniref:histidine--tRNA ligase n=1 Tax=Hydrogenophaga sp. 5NK40-0174 TaxID=3127649 RepID=UPI0031087A48